MRAHVWLGLSAAATLSATAPAAAARADYLRYDIPAQRLDQALLLLGVKSGRQISFAPELVRGKVSRRLSGHYELGAALARMLPDDDLRVDLSGSVILILPRTPAAISPVEPASPPRPPPTVVPLEELSVTALKHETLLQKTPISITLLGRGVSERGDTSVSDYYRRAPGLHMTANSGNLQRLSIRGVRSAGEATTGVYYDETPVTGPAGSAADAGSTQPDLNLFDVSRVEVLRGPQGTLYGAGSMGGTVRVIFNKPDLDTSSGLLEGRGKLSQEGEPGGSVHMLGNVPLIEGKLAARVALYGERTGGYIDNVRLGRDNINGAESGGGRLSLAYAPTRSFSLLMMATHQQEEADDAVNYWYPRLGRYKTDARIVADYRSIVDLTNLTAKWELPTATLLATASRYGWKTLTVTDYTSTLQRAAADPAACRAYFAASACSTDQAAAFADFAASRTPGAWHQPATLHARNYEVRLTSLRGARVEWTAGYFFENRRDHFDSIVYRADAASGSVLRAGADVTGYRYVETEVSQRALFGETNLHATEKLTFTFGARRYRYDKTVGGEVVTPNRITGSELTPFAQVAARNEGWVKKAAITYDLSNAVMVYASRSEGFRPGGANNVPGAGDAVPLSYDPDELVSYEAGAKTAWFDDRLTVNLSVYRIDWTDMQVSVSSTSGAWRFNTNAGKARISGGELELSARPRPGLYISANAAMINAHLVADQRNGLGVAPGIAGDRLPYTPRWTAGVYALHRWKAWDRYNAVARFDYSYVGETASDFHPSLVTYEKQPAHGLVDLQLSAERRGIETSLRLTNLFNVRAPGMVTANLSGVHGQTWSTRPRTLTLMARQVF